MQNYNSKFKTSKFFLRVGSLFAVVLFLFGIAFFYSWGEASNLEVNFFNVGQGDAILIKTPKQQKILIDGGPDNKIIYKLGRNLPFFEREIDLVILTHPHADHLTGLVEVLKRYKVKKILTTGVIHTTPEYLEWLREISKQNMPIEIAQAGQVINFDENLKLEILYPLENLAERRVENLNNTSIVSKLIFGRTSFLFVGDAESEVEEKLISEGVDLKVDVLKVAHHGSKDATSYKFLDKVQPKITVIMVGAKNKFGHPSQTVVNRLEKMGVKILRTDKNGDIKILSNGEKLIINN